MSWSVLVILTLAASASAQGGYGGGIVPVTHVPENPNGYDRTINGGVGVIRGGDKTSDEITGFSPGGISFLYDGEHVSDGKPDSLDTTDGDDLDTMFGGPEDVFEGDPGDHIFIMKHMSSQVLWYGTVAEYKKTKRVARFIINWINYLSDGGAGQPPQWTSAISQTSSDLSDYAAGFADDEEFLVADYFPLGETICSEMPCSPDDLLIAFPYFADAGECPDIAALTADMTMTGAELHDIVDSLQPLLEGWLGDADTACQ